MIRKSTAAIQQFFHVRVAAVHDVGAFVPFFIPFGVVAFSAKFFGYRANGVFDIGICCSFGGKRASAAFLQGRTAVLLCKPKDANAEPVGLDLQFPALQDPLDQLSCIASYS